MEHFLFTCSLLLLTLSLPAQEPYVALTTESQELLQGQPNLQLEVLPLPFLSLSVRVAKRSVEEQQGNFTTQLSGRLASGELRVYPFGKPRSYKVGVLSNRGIRHYFAYDDHWTERFLKGLFVGLGHEYETTDMTFIPAASLNSTYEAFDYTIENNGSTIHVGYGATFSHMRIEVGYRWKVSRPQWQGPVDIFKNDLLTTEYPSPRRLENGLSLSLGVSF